jgi:hypothetical protein
MQGTFESKICDEEPGESVNGWRFVFRRDRLTNLNVDVNVWRTVLERCCEIVAVERTRTWGRPGAPRVWCGAVVRY